MAVGRGRHSSGEEVVVGDRFESLRGSDRVTAARHRAGGGGCQSASNFENESYMRLRALPAG